MAERKLRVLLMIDEASLGGGQQHVLWLARGLDRSRFDVAVACEPSGYLVDELHASGIAHFPLTMSNSVSLRALRDARSCIRNWRPDVVHTHGGTAGATGRIAARSLSGCKIVHTYHGHHYLHAAQGRKRNLFRLADRMLLTFTHHTICVAAKDRDTGISAGIIDPARNTVILNGIDTERFVFPREYTLKEEPVLGTIGRLHVQKGHRYLLDAMRLVLDRMPRVRLSIVGGGGLRDELAAQAESLGIGGSVSFRGEQTDAAGMLRSMDLFVLPSLWEGFPIVLLEAMASGVPIVATAVDGVNEMLRDGESALLVRPANAEELAAAILRLLQDEGLRRRMGVAAQAEVRARFGMERMIRETENVYEGVCQ